jgi:hypothetical protein
MRIASNGTLARVAWLAGRLAFVIGPFLGIFPRIRVAMFAGKPRTLVRERPNFMTEEKR